MFAAYDLRLPDLPADRFFIAAMEMVGVVVDRQGVFFSVQRELTFRNAIAHATDRAAEILIAFTFVAAHVIKSIDDVSQFSVPIRHMQFHQRRSEGRHLGD